MAMTWVALATRPTPLNASVTSMFVNTVGKEATPRGIVATANSAPLASCNSELLSR